MAILKCAYCGGDLIISEDSKVCECAACHAVQLVPTADKEAKQIWFSRAEENLHRFDFDAAADDYEMIIREFPSEAEAYWKLVLCRYGVQYEYDIRTHEEIPTMHRLSYQSVLDDEDYLTACECAGRNFQGRYRRMAMELEKLRKEVIAYSAQEEPYDVFISYKETDDLGRRTEDSVKANELYDALTAAGYRVFYSRISMESKAGMPVEPVIFAALHSARIMMLVAGDASYINSPWVKNEWRRYLTLTRGNKDLLLLPCLTGEMSAEELPEKLSGLQARRISSFGEIDGIVELVRRRLGPGRYTEGKPQTAEADPIVENETLILAALKAGEWDKADELAEAILDINAEYAPAYLYKLQAALRISNRKDLPYSSRILEKNRNYHKALEYGDDTLRAMLTGANYHTKYVNAQNVMFSAKDSEGYRKAQALYEAIREYSDAAVQAERSREKAEEAKRFEDYEWACKQFERKEEQNYGKALEILQRLEDCIPSCSEKIKEAERQIAETNKENRRFKIGVGFRILIVALVLAAGGVFWFWMRAQFDTSPKSAEEILERTMDRAESGNMDSMYTMGLRYQSGNGVEKDPVKAFEYFKSAADKGHKEAGYLTGCCYLFGEGVTPDDVQAFVYFEKSAEKNYAPALNETGICYEKGRGVEQDPEKAVEYYKKAVDNGSKDAVYNLGLCAKNGVGMEADPFLAFEYFSQAAENGDGGAYRQLGDLYKAGEGVEYKDYEKAAEMYQKAADLGNDIAMVDLGLLYAEGKGVDVDEAHAAELFRQGAEHGNIHAMYNLGVCYEQGFGVEQDTDEAVNWYRKAAEEGQKDAQAALERLGE